MPAYLGKFANQSTSKLYRPSGGRIFESDDEISVILLGIDLAAFNEPEITMRETKNQLVHNSRTC
jgi:hypothetical protein